MLTRPGLALTALLLTGGATVPTTTIAASFDFDQTMLESIGEFEVGNDQSQIIANRKTDKAYRICVRAERHSVPLKVTFDGKFETVAPGSCVDVEGMRISLAPASKLTDDTVLVGRYTHLKAG